MNIVKLMHLLALVLLWLLLCGHAHGAAPLQLDPAVGRYVLDENLEYVEDRGGRLDLDAVRALPPQSWRDNGAVTPNFGFTASAYWFRLRLHNSGDLWLDRLLEIDYALLDDIEAFQLVDGQLRNRWHVGDKLPFEQRPFLHHNFILPFGLPPAGNSEILLRVRTSSSMQVPLTLRTASSLAQKDQQESLLFGAYFGVAFAMFAYNFILLLGSGDRNYLYYLLWLVCLTGFLAAINGLTFQYLWPNATWWNDQVVLIMMCGLGAAATMFAIEFLKLRDSMPARVRIMQLLVSLTLALALAALLLPYGVLVRPTMLALLLMITLLGYTAFQRLRAGFRPARFFALSWSLILSGGALLNFNKFGLIPRNLLTEYMTPLGAMVEMVLLAIALADRFNTERRQREQAQRQVLSEQAQVLQVQQQANLELEARVKLRTDQLASANTVLQHYLARISRLQAISELGPGLVHEMKQPLAAIRSFSQGILTLMAKEQLQAPKVEHGLQRILRTVDESLQLIGRLRAFVGPGESETEPVDLNDCVQEAIDWIRPMCSSANVQIEPHLASGLPLLDADPILLRQVVLNLLRNALEAIENSHAPQRIIRVATFSDAQQLGCRVADSGPGISAEHQARLFDPLFTTKSAGMGLGLKISRAIVEQFGGRLSVENPSGGASMVFVFSRAG